MAESARELIQAHLDNDHLAVFANRLTEWLIADLNRSDETVPDFTESRARALLRAANVVDDPTRHNFAKLMENNVTAVRLALYDLLKESQLAENQELAALTAMSGAAEPDDKAVAWSALAIAAFAWKDGYPLYQLDPATPPGIYTPAGQLITRAAHFMRQQVQRTATERDKLGRQVAYQPTAVAPGTPSLEQLPPQSETPPLPPHYRPPIPVRYPEVARDTIQIADEDAPDLTLNVAEGAEESAIPPRAPQIIITEQDLPGEKRPATMPPIRIERSQVQPPAPRPVINTRPQNEFGQAVQRRYRSRGPMSTTKLRITVQEYTDGPGLYGVQVRVKCQGIRSYVAGTTNREGKFLCELPVPRLAGLTYDAEVTWPRDVGGDVERKSITLNADRTEFTLPFYRRVHK